MLLANLDDVSCKIWLQTPVIYRWRCDPLHAINYQPCTASHSGQLVACMTKQAKQHAEPCMKTPGCGG